MKLRTYRKGNLIRSISIFMIFAFLNLTGGCYYYKSVTSPDPPSELLGTDQLESKYIILHKGNHAWAFSDYEISGDSIKGKISELIGHDYYLDTQPDKANKYIQSSDPSKDEREVINEVHITVSDYITLEANMISIPLESVQKIEIYDRDSGATTASWIFGGLGLTVGVLAVVAIIVALTKSSCPFIYTYNGTHYTFCGEIYSGTIFPPLERDDYLLLHDLKEKDDLYSIQMKNEVREIQHTNLAELIVFDHPHGTEACIDKYGNAFCSLDSHSPVTAMNLQGENVLPLILSRDSLSYFGSEPVKDQDPADGAIMEFEIPEGTTSAGLVLRAKNSFWLDYVFTRFHGLFGASYDQYMDKQSNVSRSELKERMLDQGLPLSVYLEKNGEWEFQDYFNIAGPMALRDDFLSLDLSGTSPGPVRIKLEYGLYFWELDYVGLDFHGDQGGKTQVVRLESAVDNTGADVKDLMYSNDDLYYIQPEVGDAVEMSFRVPVTEGMQRSVFLHSKGHYKILRDQTGKPDIKSLKSLNKESGLSKFSLDLILDLYPLSQN